MTWWLDARRHQVPFFWVFGITRPRIKPRSPRSLVNTKYYATEKSPSDLKTCCHSNSSERPSANAGVKNSQRLTTTTIIRRNSPPSMIDEHSKWRDDCKKQTYPNEWPKERPYWSKKTRSKEPPPNNYRPITFLPMRWKILTAQIKEEIYYSLTSRGLFSETQIGYCKGSRGTRELLYIDQHIFIESKTRRRNLVIAWIDSKVIWYDFAQLDNKLPPNQ